MSYYRHDAVVAVFQRGSDAFPLAKPTLEAIEQLRSAMPRAARKFLWGPFPTGVNDFWVVVFLPDGENEGGAADLEMDRYREDFKRLIRNRPHVSGVHVRFGGDEPEALEEPEAVIVEAMHHEEEEEES